MSDKIQIAITFFTACAVGVALFGERIWKSIESPRIKVLFDPNKTDFYHRTTMEISTNVEINASIPTYYIRLKVKNEGIDTLKNVEVVLEEVQPRTKKPFMSLNLNWAGFIVDSNDIKRTVDIPRGQTRTLDVFEFMEFSSTRLFYDDLKKLKVTDAVRYEELSEGFRSCTIKPLSRSDIFPRGTFNFKLGIYADRVEPKFLNMSVNYTGNWIETTTDKEMRSKHLKVEVS